MQPDDLRSIHLIPYYHHDYAWCSTRSWHIWRYIRAFEETLDLMRVHPDLTLTVDNMLHSLREFQRYCPSRMEEFAQRVREGRICVSNGGMALARPTAFDGELYIRNAADGAREFRKLFGLSDIPTFWNADAAPGHAQMPQLMRLLGVRLYRFKRPEAALTAMGVPEVFRWRGLDGSEVLVDRTAYSISWNETFEGLNEENWPEMRRRFVDEHLAFRMSRINTPDIIAPFGGDDRLPQRSAADRPVNIDGLIAAWNAHEKSRMLYSTPDRFLAAIGDQSLPVWDGVLDACELSFNAPFRADRSLWRARFGAERAILLCERLEAIRSLMRGPAGGPPADAAGEGTVGAGVGGAPAVTTEALWQRAYEFAGHAMQFLLDDDYGPVLDSARATVTLARERARELARGIAALAGGDTRRRHVVINPSSVPFDGLAELHITSEAQVEGLRLLDEAGRELPWQLTRVYRHMAPGGRPGQYSEVNVVCPLRVPANGFASVFVRSDGATMPDIAMPGMIMPDIAVPAGPADPEIDNGVFSARFENGLLTELRQGGRTLTAGKPFGVPRFVRTAPTASWYTDWESLGEVTFIPESSRVALNGPLRWEIEAAGHVGDSPAALTAVIERENPEIVFRLTLDNRQGEGYFLADFPCGRDPALRAGAPFGEEPRDTASDVRAPRSPGEVSFLDFERGWEGQLWANGYVRMRLGGAEAAALQGDCGIYWQNVPGSGQLSLLLMKSIDLAARSDEWVRQMSPDTEGKGLQHFRYGFVLPAAQPAAAPAGGAEASEADSETPKGGFGFPEADSEASGAGSGASDPVRDAVERFRLPLMDEDRFCLEPGGGADRFSAFTVSPGVRVTAFRRDGDTFLLRLFEAEGAARTCEVRFCRPVGAAAFVDLLDRPAGREAAVTDGCAVRFGLRAWEIATLRVRLG